MLKAKLKMREADHSRVQLLLSQREKSLQAFAAENRLLKKEAGKPESWGLDPDELELLKDKQVGEAQATILHLESRVQKLEDERLEMLREMRQQAIARAEHGLVFLGTTAGQTKLIEDYAEKLRIGTGDVDYPLSDESKELTRKLK